MMTAKEVRQGIVNLIRKAGIKYDVHFNHVNKANKTYIWVEMRVRKESFDRVYFQRIINIDIQVVLMPDINAEVKHTDLLEIADKLDVAIMPCVEIKDRFITVQKMNSHIFDDILHYEFELDFTDCVKDAEYEGVAYDLMERLEARLNEGTSMSVYVEEKGEKNGETW